MGTKTTAETAPYGKPPSKPTRTARGTAVLQKPGDTNRSSVPAYQGVSPAVRNQTAAADLGDHGPDRRGGKYGEK